MIARSVAVEADTLGLACVRLTRTATMVMISTNARRRSTVVPWDNAATEAKDRTFENSKHDLGHQVDNREAAPLVGYRSHNPMNRTLNTETG